MSEDPENGYNPLSEFMKTFLFVVCAWYGVFCLWGVLYKIAAFFLGR